MWNSTTRAGFLSLITGTLIISLIFKQNDRKQMLKKVGQGVAIVVLMLALNIGMSYFGLARAYALINKTMDMVMNTSTFGKRHGYGNELGDIYGTPGKRCGHRPL